MPDINESTESVDVIDTAFEDAWDAEEDGFSPLSSPAVDNADDSENDSPEDEAEADQPDADSDSESEVQTDSPDVQPDVSQEADQLFDLKYFGENKQVNREEVVSLAQKGMDYDRIRADRDSLKSQLTELNTYKEFLQELAAPNGWSIEELMDATRGDLIATKEGIDKATARQRAKDARLSKSSEKTDEIDEVRKADYRAFALEHPDLDANQIPKDVWDAVNDGKLLTDAYNAYENRQLKAAVKDLNDKIAAIEINQKNKEKSTGSRKSAGNTKQKRDAFDEGWDSEEL